MSRVGQSPPRSDGAGKVNGSALFIDDMTFAGAWHGVTVRCPYAHARIMSLDVSKLLGRDDVVVVTAKDLPGANVLKLIFEDWRVLADGDVQHAYEAVALVAAPTREAALAAAKLVEVHYEALAPVTTYEQALAKGDSHQLAKCNINHGDVDAVFASPPAGAITVSGTYETGYQEHLYIETNGMVAEPTDAGVTITGSMQCPYYVHKALTYLLSLPDEAVRVVQATTGGGFGGKEDYPDMIAAHVALLALKAKRPVKMIYDREEDIRATTKRHPARVNIKSLVAQDGTFLAHDIEVFMDGGAYITLSPVVLSRGVLHSAGPYRTPNVRVRGKSLKTNTCPNGAFRGFGAPQTEFAIECHVDRIGRALGIDPLSIRRKNAYQLGDVTATGQELTSSVSAHMCLEEAEKRTSFSSKWKAYEAERQARIDNGQKWRGIGIALFWHGAGFTGNGEKRIRAVAQVFLNAQGKIEVHTSSTDIGQGTIAAFELIVADALNIAQGHVTMPLPDTKVVPDSGPTVASRTIMVVGGVLTQAAQKLGAALCAFASEVFGESKVVIQNDMFVSSAGKSLATFAELAQRYVQEKGTQAFSARWEPLPEQNFDEATYRGMAYPTFAWGCDVVEVEVDPDTLNVQPVGITAVCEVGKVIHPVLCTGQVDGGTLQAVAWGYMEEIKTKDGRYMNDRLATYIIPTARDVPDMQTVLLENPGPTGPHGAKGVGELPMDGGAPALVNALACATGLDVKTIPATPERLLSYHLRNERIPGGAA